MSSHILTKGTVPVGRIGNSQESRSLERGIALDQKPTRANVYCRGVLAGVLSKDRAKGYRFQYVPEYLSNSRCPPIGLAFPKQEAPFESPVLFPFFFGLLAEGDDKVLQCRVLKIDEHDHFTRLLKTCQAETIGGITVREVVPA